MDKHFFAMALAGLISLACISTAAAAPEAPHPATQDMATVLVLELGTKDFERGSMTQYIDLLSGALFRTGSVTVIDAARRDAALSEIEFSSSAAADRQAQIEAGRQLAATLVVTGSLGAYDGKIVASLRAVETATGKVAGSADEVYDGIEELFADAERIARALLRSALPSQARKAGLDKDVLRPSQPPKGGSSEGTTTVPGTDPLANLEPTKAPPFSPFQFSIFAPLQIVPARTAIYGLRLGMGYSDNAALIGLDFGIVNKIGGEAKGIQCGVVNITGDMLGLQAGLVGMARSVTILQMNAAFNSAQSVLGAQVGIVNRADKCMGIQFGLVNIAGILKGVQIGLANVVLYGEWAGFMPFVNVRL